jgi:hypothetical protein
MTVGKVSNFNFSSAGKTVGRCNDGMTKMASGGYYSKGGMKEPATGEMYPSRRAMMKHESMETPRMQREEVMQSRTVKAPPTPMRRQMPVAPSAPMIQAGGMKKGGFVKGGTGMVKTEGTLGIKGNKNPGESNGKPTTATKKGNVPFKKGGEVKKYADGGPATQTGALNQMAQQQRLTPSQIARQQALAAQAAGQPMSQAQQMANLQGAMSGSQMMQNQSQLNAQALAQHQQQMQQQQPMPPQPMPSQPPQEQTQQQMLDAYRRQGQNQGLAPMGGQPTQTMLAGSQPMPPGQSQQMSPQQQQQMMAAFTAARAGQGMPGQQGPVGLGQAMGGQQQGLGLPPQSLYNGTPSAPSPQMASYAQQGLGRLGQGMLAQPLGGPQPMPTQQGMQQQSQFNGGGIGQYGGAVGQMGMGMGKFP